MQAVREVRAAKRRPRSAGASRSQGPLVKPPWAPPHMTGFEAQRRPKKEESRESGSAQQQVSAGRCALEGLPALSLRPSQVY